MRGLGLVSETYVKKYILYTVYTVNLDKSLYIISTFYWHLYFHRSTSLNDISLEIFTPLVVTRETEATCGNSEGNFSNPRTDLNFPPKFGGRFALHEPPKRVWQPKSQVIYHKIPLKM